MREAEGGFHASLVKGFRPAVEPYEPIDIIDVQTITKMGNNGKKLDP